MNTSCYEPPARRGITQTPLFLQHTFAHSLASAKYLFLQESQVDEPLEGPQIERYVLQRPEADLRRVAAFQADWDGAGSPPPSRAAVSNASAALSELYRICCASDVAWRSPHVSANENGEVSFEWWHEARKLTMYFGADTTQVVKVWGIHLFDEMDIVDLQEPAGFGPLWIWLHGR